MELQNQLNGDLSRYFSNQQSVEDSNLSFNEIQCTPVRMDGNSNPYCNLWMHSYSGSFAMDARIRLETLKSRSNSPVSTSIMNGPLYSYNYSEDIWDIGLNESALDSVELLDVEGAEQDEESWLYVIPKKQNAFVERTEPALNWCRHVLDNHSPEMEAACCQLLNRLNLKMSSPFRDGRLQQTGSFSVDSSIDRPSVSHSVDYDDNEMSRESTCYSLQNITDVYDIARLQEASLRQDWVYTLRKPDSPVPASFNTNTTNTSTEKFIHRNKTEVSTNRSPDVFSMDQSPTPVPGQSCQSPKLTRLQQVTQYKLLRRAQNQGSSSRSSSPLRTSLRSLQAVRSSRSLDIDDYRLDHIIQPTSGLPSHRTGLSSSSSHSNTFLDSDVPVWSASIKRCQRSHSLSPCRIPQPALASQSRVFASPERSRSAAWLRNTRHSQQ